MSEGFPTNVNVTVKPLSPGELDAIGRVAGESAGRAVSQAIERLRASIEQVSGVVQKQTISIEGGFSGVQQDLKLLQVEVIGQLLLEVKAIQAVEQEVNRSIKAGVQAQISKFLGDLEGLKTAVRIALLQVAEIFGKSVKRQRAIFEKYGQMEAEVMRAFERDIRKLGEPIYRFIENEYFPLLELSKGFVEDTQKSLKRSTHAHLERRERLDDIPQEKLQQARADFIRNTQGRTPSRSQTGSGLKELEDGLIHLESLYCATADKAKPGKYISSIRRGEGAGATILLSEVTASEDPGFGWRACTDEEKSKMVAAFTRLQTRGLISESHAQFLSLSVKAHGYQTRVEGAA